MPPAKQRASSYADEHFLTTDELADLLNVPRRTVEAWRYRRCGPPGVRMGRHVRYRWSAVQAWLRQREEADTGDPSTCS